ncbi:type II secretion system F family protein [Acidobacteriota bacterium]
MPYFLCRLATEDGRTFSQSFFAPSQTECKKYFEEEGFCVLSIRKDWKRLQIPVLPFEKKIKDKDFIMFNRELVALIKAGYPILKSVEIIVNRTKNLHFKELLIQVEKRIRDGKSLSEAFSPHEKMFSKVYIASLMAGERSGNLAGTIARFIDYEKIIARTKARIKSALTYPSLLLLFSLFLIFILINFILPRFSEFYVDFEAELPVVTQGLIAFSLFVKGHLLYILTFFFLLALVYLRMRRKEKSLILLDKTKLKIPYGRTIWLESAVSLFCRTLSLLLGGGISLLSSIGIATQAVPNKFLVQKLNHLPDFIKNGKSLSESLSKADFFPLLSLDMIRIGEASANLEGLLMEVADVYDERIRTKIDTFVSLIEPIIIIFMGLIVAVMLLSVYLPIFNIIRVTQ